MDVKILTLGRQQVWLSVGHNFVFPAGGRGESLTVKNHEKERKLEIQETALALSGKGAQ